MIDHISLGTTRYGVSVAFYQRIFAPLGMALQRDTGAEAAFGTASHWSFFLYPIADIPAVTAPGAHFAFAAATHAEVVAVYEAALAAGATSRVTPCERPDISSTYFGAIFLDLDGHRIEVLTNAP
jgi:catechol 2,3-dioxygenase-like lactoylglutathione lyase family enzyme